jgi:hypothetical protein
MTVDSARGTAGCHQIECAEPSPSECVKIASAYVPLSSTAGSILRKNGGSIGDPATITCWCTAALRPQINSVTDTEGKYRPRAIRGSGSNAPVRA